MNHHNISEDCATIKTCWKKEQEGGQAMWLEGRSVSLFPYEVAWSMREIISWAENSMGHRKRLHSTAPCIPPKIPHFAHTSPCIWSLQMTWEWPQSLALLFCWEKNDFYCGRVQRCRLTPVPPSSCHVQHLQGSTARPKAEARETGQGSPELGPCSGQQSKALEELSQMPWGCHLLVILLSLGAAHNEKSWFHCGSGMLSIISVQSFNTNYLRY